MRADMGIDIQRILDALVDTPLGKRLNEYQVSVKCPICNEGDRERNHSHCYIGPIDGHPPLVYHCWINDCSGVVTPNFLHDLNIYDLELDRLLNAYNRSNSISKPSSKIKEIVKRRKNIEIPEVQDTALNEYKLRYMQKRLGVAFSYENLHSLNVVFDMDQFMEHNGLTINPKYKKYRKILAHDYIGFLSTQRDWLILRDTTDTRDLRYVKYSLFDSIDRSEIVFTVPGTQSDIFADDVNLNVCEGTFDALGIFCHVKKYDRINNIYAACCGSGYVNTIRYFIRLGFIGNLNVNIYSDSDKRLKFYRDIDITGKIKPWVKSIRIMYNSISKDYGVPKKLIDVHEALWI